jgi:hypothetical protein
MGIVCPAWIHGRCARQVIRAITINGFLVMALVLRAFAAALVSGSFKPSRLKLKSQRDS